MSLKNENAVLRERDNWNESSSEPFSFEKLEERLEGQLKEELTKLQRLQEDRDKISNPDDLGETIKNVVWEQFLNQIAATAGEDFVKENRGLRLDLRKEAHIQTTSNFAEGKIATHNTEIDYQERYDKWRDNFQTDSSKVPNSANYRFNEDKQVVEKYDTRSGSWKTVLKPGAREPYDKGRPMGCKESGKQADHTVPAAEMIRDPATNAHMTEKERVEFANSDKNLNLMDSAANQSKGDSTVGDWLESERDGKKPAERFPINEEELRAKDKEAREELQKRKAEAEQRSIDAGKKSRRAETRRIGKKALRAVVLQLFTELLREIIVKLVAWFKMAERKLDTLLITLKEAITSFVGKLKTHLMNSAKVALTTIASAIWGPIVGVIQKTWIMLKQGWHSLKEAIAYIKNPDNKGKSIGLLMLEVGKIIVAGLSATGAIVLSEVIEKALIAIPGAGPIFAFEIPLLGSLANILGIFLGAVVAGIIGAIAINLIQKKVEKKLKSENTKMQIDTSNEVLIRQSEIQAVNEKILGETIENTGNSIRQRHEELTKEIRKSVENILDNCKENNKISSKLDDMLEELGKGY